MRLFPPPYEGLHPAFPVQEPPFYVSLTVQYAARGSVLGSLVRVTALGFSRLFSISNTIPWRFANSAVALGLLGGVSIGFMTQQHDTTVANGFLQDNGIAERRSNAQDEDQ